MMSQGRSFSGHERNCCFLNMAANPAELGRFANISAGSGLDLPDDGRSIALVDWDHDGDLDLWISNRNAPRLRFMRNDVPVKNHFLALHLQGNGTTTNRDAIGARVEVVLQESHAAVRRQKAEGGRPKSLKTLRAGEGYLAQSSKWLHFGLGTADKIDKIIVRWPNRAKPGGDVEELTGLGVDQRYRLIQGSGQAQLVAPRNLEGTLEPSVPELRRASRVARVPVDTLIKLQKIEFRRPDGQVIASGTGKPLLINLWATWCPACVKELGEFRDRASEIRAAGIEIAAMSVDGLGNDRSQPADAVAFLRKIHFPFGAGPASERFVTNLQNVHNRFVAMHRPLPLPSSFLIDGEGRLAVIYKGPLSVDTLIADINHSRGTRAERWLRSVPLGGRSIQHEVIVRAADNAEATLHLSYARRNFKRGLMDLAKYHYLEVIRTNPDFEFDHRELGSLYFNEQKWNDAEVHFLRALETAPNDPAGHFILASTYVQQGKMADAQAHFERTVQLKPDHVEARFELAQRYLQQGEAAAAIQQFRSALQVKPDHVMIRVNLAWLLATHPDDEIRDGPEGVRLATELMKQTDSKHPRFLDVLAAAQAETGRFREAIASARRAVALAHARNQKQLAQQIEARVVDYYQKNRAYHQR